MLGLRRTECEIIRVMWCSRALNTLPWFNYWVMIWWFISAVKQGIWMAKSRASGLRKHLVSRPGAAGYYQMHVVLDKCFNNGTLQSLKIHRTKYGYYSMGVRYSSGRAICCDGDTVYNRLELVGRHSSDIWPSRLWLYLLDDLKSMLHTLSQNQYLFLLPS